MANEYYNCEMAGFSIPASEHSTITSWGKENEKLAYENMLTQFGKENSIFACVSDSYDIFNACEKIWGEELKQKIITSKATLVIRPDSGIPWEIVPQVLEILDKQFGSVLNKKGFKVLKNVKVIQGDGIEYESISKILEAIKSKGFSASNLAFGMGGALLQKIDRDTGKFAYKCSAVKVNGKLREVSKDPITDSGKKSKEGILELVRRENQILTVKREDVKEGDQLLFETVFENGEILKTYSLEEIRLRAKI
jgi:nicotinamide phosphoribosyltransferase